MEGDRDVVVEEEAELRRRVQDICTGDWQHFTVLAERLDEIPWDVNRACKYLMRNAGVLTEGRGELRGSFRLASSSG